MTNTHLSVTGDNDFIKKISASIIRKAEVPHQWCGALPSQPITAAKTIASDKEMSTATVVQESIFITILFT
jgi:hypothetical protein